MIRNCGQLMPMQTSSQETVRPLTTHEPSTLKLQHLQSAEKQFCAVAWKVLLLYSAAGVTLFIQAAIKAQCVAHQLGADTLT